MSSPGREFSVLKLNLWVEVQVDDLTNPDIRALTYGRNLATTPWVSRGIARLFKMRGRGAQGEQIETQNNGSSPNITVLSVILFLELKWRGGGGFWLETQALLSPY